MVTPVASTLGLLATSIQISTDARPEWAVAIGTLALAAATAWMAWKTRDVAGATREAAEAAKTEARAALEAAQAARAEAEASRATVDEIRRDRELAWRPVLTVEVPTVTSGEGTLSCEVRLMNVGRGPAVNCLHAHTRRGSGAAPSFSACHPTARSA